VPIYGKELVCRTLKEKCLGPNMKALVGNVEELNQVWNMLDTRYDQPLKYIAEALEPVIKFGKCKVFEPTAI
jgi:hypothetical protein